MTDKEIIAVIQAHIEGKQIQFRYENSLEWLDCTDNKPSWDFSSYDYRVKPESKTRPYKDRKECWNDMLKHQPFGWVKSKAGNYTHIDIVNDGSNFSEIHLTHTYVDGSPFGIVEEE